MNLEQVNAVFSEFRAVAGLGDYDSLLALMNSVVSSGQAGPGGDYEDLFLTLADLIEAHDKRDYRFPDATPAQAVKFLMEQHGLTQSEVPEIGNQSVVSQVLAGRRHLNVRQISRLCERFGVGAGLFVQVPEMAH